MKPDSCHDNKVKYGVFKGFIHRAKEICSDKYVEEELEFLISVFIENGYKEETLRNIVLNFKSGGKKDNATRNFVSLPFIPNVSNKLKTVFQKAGFNPMFRSGRSLSSILTSRNKPKLPRNSYPGVYRQPCECLSRYIGHTGKKVSTRGLEHEKAVFQGNWNHSALSAHTKDCHKGIVWEEFCTLSTEPNYYRRAIMEALEIQREEVCNPNHKIINDRAGLYVTTDTWKPFF